MIGAFYNHLFIFLTRKGFQRESYIYRNNRYRRIIDIEIKQSLKMILEFLIKLRTNIHMIAGIKICKYKILNFIIKK